MTTERHNPTGDPASAANSLDTGAVSVLADEAAPPTWFQRRRARAAEKARERAARRKPEPLVVVGEEAQLTWDQKLRRWLLGVDAVGMVVSLVLHAALLVALSLVLVKGMQGNDRFSTMLSQSEEPEQLDTILESPLEEPGGLDQVELPQMQVLPEMQPDEMTVPVPDDLMAESESPVKSEGEGETAGESAGLGGGGLRFEMPERGEAVTKGSFTVWTVPEDPEPGERYLIVIQIRLPENIDRYPLRDLSGLVEGTDRYRQPIGGRYARGTLPVVANNVQVSVMVPGAAQLVRDKIRVRSKILKESQTLEIVF